MNIALIGMSGVGKSIIGKQLAAKLKYRFIDIDKTIEAKTKMKLQQTIDKFGEEKLLRLEENAILVLKGIENSIISPGGSVIYSIKAMRHLKKYSVVIFLNDSISNIKLRAKNFSERGIIGLKNNTLEQLYYKRLPIYEKWADLVITFPDSFDLNHVTDRIIHHLNIKKYIIYD
ncbi:MAG: (d)CMP kinase [Patescibacteria group bacterium]|nr:(d)CMP kinase [Patescibacteria group bacterium]